MSLLDDLRHVGDLLDIQYQPATNEVQKLLGAFIHYSEHGDKLLQAAEEGAEDVQALIDPAAKESVEESHPSPATSPPSPAAAPTAPEVPGADPAKESDADIERQISDLEALLASRRATSQQTVLDTPSPAAAPSPAPVPSTDAPSTGSSSGPAV